VLSPRCVESLRQDAPPSIQVLLECTHLPGVRKQNPSGTECSPVRKDIGSDPLSIAVRFDREADGLYPVEKHGHELPPSELTGNAVKDSLASAQRTVRRGLIESNRIKPSTRRTVSGRSPGPGAPPRRDFRACSGS